MDERSSISFSIADHITTLWPVFASILPRAVPHVPVPRIPILLNPTIPLNHKVYRYEKLPRLNLKESEPFIPYKALLIVLSSVSHTAAMSCTATMNVSATNLRQPLTEPLLTLVCVSISSARRSFYVPLLWKDLCLYPISHSLKNAVISTLFGVFYVHIISVDSGINSTYCNNHL